MPVIANEVEDMSAEIMIDGDSVEVLDGVLLLCTDLELVLELRFGEDSDGEGGLLGSVYFEGDLPGGEPRKSVKVSCEGGVYHAGGIPGLTLNFVDLFDEARRSVENPQNLLDFVATQAARALVEKHEIRAHCFVDDECLSKDVRVTVFFVRAGMVAHELSAVFPSDAVSEFFTVVEKDVLSKDGNYY